MSLSKDLLSALLPPGSLWVPQDGADLDKLLDGIANNFEAMRLMLASLADLRNPLLTGLLVDLETEYGLTPTDALSIADRRIRLLATMTSGNSDGSLDFMEENLRAAGFDVRVYANTPAVDPSLFTSNTPNSTMGNNDAIFGKDGVVFGGRRGYLLVNGAIYYNQELVQYESPVDPIYWPMVFFIGGEATRNTDGSLLTIETVSLPVVRKTEFIRLVIKYKPMHAWCGAVVSWVN